MRKFLLMAVYLAFFIGYANAQSLVEPGGDDTSAILALRNPDEYAWTLFLYINRPAETGKAGVPATTGKFGDISRPLVWESWALSSGDDLSETYPRRGEKPLNWDKLPRGNDRQLILEPSLTRLAFMNEMQKGSPVANSRFFPPVPADQEVRANKATYEFIVRNELYHLGGLEALLSKAQQQHNRQLISFDPGAKEVKAVWREISSDQKSRYLWREITDVSGIKHPWGLVSLHIITKDLPNWFWADFGHVDCESQKNACNSDGQEPALTLPNDKTTRGSSASSGVGGVRKETLNTVFANYILRGTQTDFVNPRGNPTILSNPVIENQFQTSSCMSCHARATIGARLPDRNGIAAGANTLSPGAPTLGAPNPALFGGNSALSPDEISYLQTDFIWSAPFRAKRKPGLPGAGKR